MTQNRAASKARDRVIESVVAGMQTASEGRLAGRFKIEIVRDGEVIEEFETPNLIVNQGLNYTNAAALLGGTAIGTWYLAAVSGSPTIVAGDTYASHSGWTEVTAYDEVTRPEWEGDAGAVGVVTNSANRAEFTIASGGATIGGMALVGGGSAASTKGDTAGGGTLFSASAFSGGNRTLVESDILRVTWQLTHSNA